ncbi:MAG: tyrosine-type recombinase/integrase, partial [Dongiaceae bacterium]
MTPTEALDAYCGGFAARDVERVIALFGEAALYEMPLLGSRMVGRAVSFHILRHSHGSMLAMQGVPLPVIAKQLGHADTRMTEKHYAHLSPNYVADTIRANFPTLGIVEQGKV